MGAVVALVELPLVHLVEVDPFLGIALEEDVHVEALPLETRVEGIGDRGIERTLHACEVVLVDLAVAREVEELVVADHHVADLARAGSCCGCRPPT